MKIGLIITSPIYSRNYISSNFLNGCIPKDVILLVREGVEFANDPCLATCQYSIGQLQALFSALIFKVFLLKKVRSSKTFPFRLLRGLGWDVFILAWGKLISSLKKNGISDSARHVIPLLNSIVSSTGKLITYLFLLPLVFVPEKIYALLLSIYGGDLQRALLDQKLDIVIFPFSAYEIEQNYLPGIAAKGKFKLVYCTDNWDNLSSKTVLVNYPDYITVWGEQTRQHAIKIQGVPPGRVIIAPSPRLAVYSRVRSVPMSAKTIGFVGSFLSFDEIKCLQLMELVLDNHQKVTGESWKIIYRPHPWRMARSESKRLALLSRTVLADGFDQIYTSNAWSVNFQPKLDGYVDFFSSCNFVVGGLTTMLIEAMLAKRPVIAIGFWDSKYNLLSPGAALDNYEHFVGIEKLKNLTIARSEAELSSILEKSLVSALLYSEDKRLDDFVKFDDVMTLCRLLDRVDSKNITL